MVVPSFRKRDGVVVVGTPSLYPLLSHLVSSEIGGLHGLHDRVDHVKRCLAGLCKSASPLFRVVVGCPLGVVCDRCVKLVESVAQVVECDVGW